MTAPSPWVERHIGGIARGGWVLDVACGSGRHIGIARRHGCEVTGVDRDITTARSAFGDDVGVRLVEHDLEDGKAFPFDAGSFDGVIVTNYLWRPILPDIVAAVAPGGMLIYETFRAGNERLGRPSRAEFLLRPGELLAAVMGRLHVVAFEEVRLKRPDRAVQRICAVATGHPWADLPPEMDEMRSSS